MKKKFSGAAVITASVAGFALAVLCCTFMFVAKYGGLDAFPYSTKFAAVFTALNEHYVGEMDMEEASNAAYSAMVAATGDRWSRYLTAEQYDAYRLMQQNSYKGIGVTIKNDEAFGYPKVVSLVEDSPAQKAGVMIGDHLLAVNGKSVEKMGTSEISGMIAELADKEFELSVSSGGEEKTLTIKSDVIFSDPIEYEMLEGGSIGYVRIKNFEAKSGEGLVSAVDTLIEQGAQSLVFDVRCNPGGLLSELLTALDHLLPEGDMFVSADKSGKETVRSSDAESVSLPMAVLIDANTYSAAEFFAAALSEYDMAVLVGEQTTGKSRSQINLELSDGSAVHLSTNRYLTPNRVDLTEAGGLTPDIELEMDEELLPYFTAGVLEKERDEQLKAAVEALVA